MGDTYLPAIARDAAVLCLRRAWSLLAVSASTVLALGGVLVLGDVLFDVAGRLQPFADGPLLSATQDPRLVHALLVSAGLMALTVAVAAALIAPVGVGALVAAANTVGEGRPVIVSDCFKTARDRYPGLAGTVLPLAIAPAALMAALVAVSLTTRLRLAVLGWFLSVLILRLLMAPCAVVLDGLSPAAACKRSWELTQGRRAYTFSLFAVLLASGTGLVVLLGAGLPAGISNDLHISLRLGEASAALAGAIVSPYWAMALTLLYLRSSRPLSALTMKLAAPVVPDWVRERWVQWATTHVPDPARRPAAVEAAVSTMAGGGSPEQAAGAAWRAAWS